MISLLQDVTENKPLVILWRNIPQQEKVCRYHVYESYTKGKRKVY